MADIAADGGSILFVGTKKQAQEAVKDRSTDDVECTTLTKDG